MSIHDNIEHFSSRFSEYTTQYVLIGGAACSAWYSESYPVFRATRDLDIVLILENLSESFVEEFKQYIAECGYKQWEKHKISEQAGEAKVMYRFVEPTVAQAPAQIELLSRKGSVRTLDDSCTHAPVKAGTVYTGLSCIVLDDDYYQFLISEVSSRSNLSLLSIPALMLLKIKAYLNLSQQYKKDATHGSDGSFANIRKHRNDVFFMLFSLDGVSDCVLPQALRNDVAEFIIALRSDPTAGDSIMRHLTAKYGKRATLNWEHDVLYARLLEYFSIEV